MADVWLWIPYSLRQCQIVINFGLHVRLDMRSVKIIWECDEKPLRTGIVCRFVCV